MTERWEQESLEGLDLDDGLAELPLRTSPRLPRAGDRPAAHLHPASSPPENLDLFGSEEAPAERAPGTQPGESGDGSVGPAAEPGAPATWKPAPLGERVLGGLADLAVHLGVLATALLAMSGLDLVPALGHWPGFVVFLVSFSFLYHVVPLAFWGQTPGMAWRSLNARDLEGSLLSFGQAGLRWAGGLLTAALVGLPVLLAVRQRGSLSDRISRSRTLRREA